VFGIAVGRVISDTEGDVAHLPSEEQIASSRARPATARGRGPLRAAGDGATPGGSLPST
jgi:hypothetical protein